MCTAGPWRKCINLQKEPRASGRKETVFSYYLLRREGKDVVGVEWGGHKKGLGPEASEMNLGITGVRDGGRFIARTPLFHGGRLASAWGAAPVEGC